MILGRPYVEVSEMALSLFKDPHKVGLVTREIMRLLRHLGANPTSLPLKGLSLEEETGLLLTSGHAVVVFQGVIYDPLNGLLYQPDVYSTATHQRLVRFIRI